MAITKNNKLISSIDLDGLVGILKKSVNPVYLRFYEKKEYANSLMSGFLRITSLDYFRNIEMTEDPKQENQTISTMRYDEGDGAAPKRTIPIKNNRSVFIDNLFGGGISQMKITSFTPLVNKGEAIFEEKIDSFVFCLFTFIPNDIEKLKDDLKHSLSLGNYVVLIRDCTIFSSYIRNSFSCKESNHVQGPVRIEYVDKIDGTNWGRQKLKRYSYQRESRFFFDKCLVPTPNKHWCINLGRTLNSIASIYKIID
jgi:hypothetical protein